MGQAVHALFFNLVGSPNHGRSRVGIRRNENRPVVHGTLDDLPADTEPIEVVTIETRLEKVTSLGVL
jgi:hypothetical protein